jgi:hypothetical protein
MSKSNDGERERELIEEYEICFEGPIPPSRWHSKYTDIFRTIRDIERLRYDEYGHNEKRGILPVAEMKARVRRLNLIAYRDRKTRENEATWRAHAEHEVVFRFSTEVVW